MHGANGACQQERRIARIETGVARLEEEIPNAHALQETLAGIQRAGEDVAGSLGELARDVHRQSADLALLANGVDRLKDRVIVNEADLRAVLRSSDRPPTWDDSTEARRRAEPKWHADFLARQQAEVARQEAEAARARAEEAKARADEARAKAEAGRLFWKRLGVAIATVSTAAVGIIEALK